MLRTVLYVAVYIALCSAYEFEYNDELAVEIRRELFPPLAPGKTVQNEFETYRRRRLQDNTTNSTDIVTLNKTASGEAANIVCVTCQNLHYCSILNFFMVQEVYYPNNPDFLGTCRVIEELATRLNGEIFGVGRTFRDTEQCRSIVMQYMCLFWGSNNTMYNNECSALDITNRPLLNKQIRTQTPPCRSFCVQIAEVCANDYYYFLNICWEIACPPTETFCTPDPKIGDQVVSAGIGCNMPYDANPYATEAAPVGVKANNNIIIFVTCVAVMFVSLVSAIFRW